MKKLIALVVSLAAASAGAHAATMFKCVEKGGKVSYSDRPCASSADEAWTSRPGARKRTAPAPAVAPAAAKPGPRGKAAPGTGVQPRSDKDLIDSLRQQEMARITAQQHQAPAGGAAGAGLRAQCAEELDTRACP